jgi:iron complex outermembrane receptor protein
MVMQRPCRAATLLLVAALLPCLLGAASARARTGDQDTELLEALGEVALFVEAEVLVSGATRRVAKLSEAPGTIAVVDAAELQSRGVLTLEEAIRYVTSVNFAPGSIALTSEVRDIEQAFANKVLLLQDGRLLNSVFRGNFFIDHSQPIDNVARIEVVRGPGSALYGANAFAGFINVISRKGDEIKGVEARGVVGNGDLAHGTFRAGGVAGTYDWTVEARATTFDGFDLVNEAENAEHRDAHVAAHWGKGDSKGETWFTNVSLTDVDAGVPGSTSFPTPGDSLSEQRLSLDGFKQWKPSEKVKLKLRGYYNRQDDEYGFQRAANDFGRFTDAFLNMGSVIAYDQILRWEPEFPGPEEPDPLPDYDNFLGCGACDDAHVAPLNPITGAQYLDILANGLPQVTDVQESKEWLGFVELQADWQVTKKNYLLGGLSLRVDDLDNPVVAQRQFQNKALFLEDEQRFLRDELILLGSLRIDDHSYFDLSVSPRLSLIWSPNKKLVMKTAYGKAFRSPNFVELFGKTRSAEATLYGQQRAFEEGVLGETYTRVLCQPPDPRCPIVPITEELETELQQEEISTFELWTEFTPVKRLKLILNLYQFEIAHEVGIALDRSDIYVVVSGTDTNGLRPPGVDYDGDGIIDPLESFTPAVDSFFQPGNLRDIPTLGVFLNSPDPTKGRGAELELHASPWKWLQVDWNYSRRENEQGEVRDFVEENTSDPSREGELRPTFGTRRFFIDQSTSVVTFKAKDRFWASLGFRVLGRPESSIFSGGSELTGDVTLGVRQKNLTLAATVLNWNQGGAFFDVRRDDFVDGEREVRFSVAYRHEF